MSTSVSVSPTNSAKRILPPRPLRSALVIVAFTALLYLIEFVNLAIFHGSLDQDGIHPRTLMGLPEILWAPLLHVSWAHLIGNTLPVLLFGYLAMAAGLVPWLSVTVVVWLVSGLGVWLIAPAGTTTVGASGVAFGWLMFLLVRGIFNRSFGQIAIALVLLFYWGSVLWGLLPGRADISWQGHLFGALAGVLCAFLVSRANRRPARISGPTMPGNLPV